jgi:hypothetical protein
MGANFSIWELTFSPQTSKIKILAPEFSLKPKQAKVLASSLSEEIYDR